MSCQVVLLYNQVMKLIGENLHIISKSVKEALVSKNEEFISNLILKQNNVEYIDLNIGPAKGSLENIYSWLVPLVEEKSSLKFSLDTTNIKEMKKGLSLIKNKKDSFINSASDDVERLEAMTDLCAEYDTNLIALTLSSSSGIPKTCDGRFELALDMYETCMVKGIQNERIYFDPLVLPLTVEQSQAFETLNTIKVIKESFDPVCNTVIGLSNISNGSPKELRPLLNRVFLVLAYGAGLDAAIIDATDDLLLNTIKMLDSNAPKSEEDKLLIDLTAITRDFVELEDISFNTSSKASCDIYKAAKMILNKEIYSHSFTQV